MGGPTRRRIFGDRVSGARINAEHTRQRAKEATREADAAECLLWSEQMEGFGDPARRVAGPSKIEASSLSGFLGLISRPRGTTNPEAGPGIFQSIRWHVAPMINMMGRTYALLAAAHYRA
jgi:hypothetical protein